MLNKMEKLLLKHVIWNTVNIIIGTEEFPGATEFIILTPRKEHKFSFMDRILWVPLTKLYLAPFKKWKFEASKIHSSGCQLQDKWIYAK